MNRITLDNTGRVRQAASIPKSIEKQGPGGNGWEAVQSARSDAIRWRHQHSPSNFDGFKADAEWGNYITEGDGEALDASLLWGGGDDDTHFVFNVTYAEEGAIETADRAQSAFPRPFATDCLGGGCSTFTPQGRVVLGPNFDYWDGTLNDGVLNDGMDNIPVWDPTTPDAGDYHGFSNADRFNFNGPGFNFLQTQTREPTCTPM